MEGWHLWAPLLTAVLAVLWSLRSGATEPEIRMSGLVLQLFGLITVAVGIRDTRRLFGQPHVMQWLRAWLSRFPQWRRPVIIEVGGAGIAVSGGRARLEIWTPMDATASVDAQLTALRQNVERLKEQLNQAEERMDAGFDKLSETVRQEQQARSKEDQTLDQRLKKAQTGGLHIAFAGVVLLIAGLFLSTLSPEIARLRVP
jgi:hypothetical protein